MSIKLSKEIELNMRKLKQQVGTSWRMDETYIKVKGKYIFLYRTVDKQGNNGAPRVVNIDKSDSNKAALKTVNKRSLNTPKIKV